MISGSAAKIALAPSESLTGSKTCSYILSSISPLPDPHERQTPLRARRGIRELAVGAVVAIRGG